MTGLASIMAMGRTAVGGGVATWYDSIASGSTDSDDGNPDFAHPSPVVAGQSGTCTKLRVFIGFYNFSFDIKMALYDSSFALLSSGTLTGQTSANSTWFEVPITPVAVTNAATYWIGDMHDLSADFTGRYLSSQPSGSCHFDFSGTYAAFPPSTFPTGAATRLYAYGMYVT